jgi:hypothetical protein
MSRSTPENRVKKLLDTMLKTERVWFFAPQAGPYGHAGIPDRVACVFGRFVGIECKADKSKKPTALQELCAKRIHDAGGAWFLVYDEETIEKVREFIHDCRRASQSVSSET